MLVALQEWLEIHEDPSSGMQVSYAPDAIEKIKAAIAMLEA